MKICCVKNHFLKAHILCITSIISISYKCHKQRQSSLQCQRAFFTFTFNEFTWQTTMIKVSLLKKIYKYFLVVNVARCFQSSGKITLFGFVKIAKKYDDVYSIEYMSQIFVCHLLLEDVLGSGYILFILISILQAWWRLFCYLEKRHFVSWVPQDVQCNRILNIRLFIHQFFTFVNLHLFKSLNSAHQYKYRCKAMLLYLTVEIFLLILIHNICVRYFLVCQEEVM